MSELTVPRLVATDLDGTIVRSDGTISERTVAAIARVELAGSTLVLVTGRPPRWITDIASAVAHRGLAICANGALVYDLHTEAVVRAHLIECEALAETIGRLRALMPDFRFAVEYADGFVFEVAYKLGGWDAEAYGGRPVEPADLAASPAAKLLAFLPGGDPDTLMDKVTKVAGDLVTVTHSTGRGLLEMSARGVTKATALAELCASLEVPPAEVVAFGDMPNDVPMLTWAGRSYGVANAHPDVLAVVGGRTAANDDDGVALVLEELFPAAV
jgi:Cof subfamily protein (haloacid dehalogenase superfamily)